jgi:hypothetical protein
LRQRKESSHGHDISPDVDVAEWTGAQRPYDIVKEGTIAFVIVALLTVGFSVLFGSPDEHQVTLKDWSKAMPVDFASTALSELSNTSPTSTYGAPYNTNGDGQSIGPLHLQKWMGVNVSVDTARDFVLLPLASQPDRPDIITALASWHSASDGQRSSWLDAYTKASATMSYRDGHLVVASSNSGPVPVLIDSLTTMARTGALDQALISEARFYTTDYTKPLLFLSDGSYLANIADRQHLHRRSVGDDERNRQFPGPSLAVALHHVVPSAAVLDQLGR